MKRFCLVIASLLLFAAPPLTADPIPDGAFITMQGPETTMDSIKGLISVIEDGGGRIYHVMPVHLDAGPERVLNGCCLIGPIPLDPAAESAILAYPGVKALDRGPVDPMFLELLGIEGPFAANAWNYLLAGGGEPVPPPDLEPIPDDMLEPLEMGTFGLQSQSMMTPVPVTASSPGQYQTSEFMIGSVSIGVILPESTGSGENWSTARQTSVYNAIVSGANWWATQGGAAASLTFYYDQRYSVSTQYEPITISAQVPPGNDGIWIGNVLSNMGYSGTTHFDKCYSYVNTIRNTNQTDWAFACFVADSLNDVDGLFPDGRCAYAYLHGPYMVMTYDNGNWGISRMHLVFAHEMGHTFGAGDEYGTCTCTSFGYLNVYNGNCKNCTASQVPCVMDSNTQSICTYTKGQIGWQDSDTDGKYDPVDTTPSVSIAYLDYGPVPPYWNLPGIQGHGLVLDNPCPSPTRTPVSINKVTAFYNIDGMLMLPAAPRDGAFNSSYEFFDFVSIPQVSGPHTATVFAMNSYSGSTAVSTPMNIIIDTTPPIPPPMITDGGAGTMLPDQLWFSWPPAMEDWSGIADYRLDVFDENWALVRSVWTGNVGQHTVMGLPLMIGMRYYANVTPKNGAGMLGPASPLSDGIMHVMMFFPSVADLKIGAPMHQPVGVNTAFVTSSGADEPGVVYVEQQDRTSGIRTDCTDTITRDTRVEIAGWLMQNPDGELYLQKAEVAPLIPSGPIPIRPLGMPARSVGGGPLGMQMGVPGGTGLNTIGLLVRTWGTVTFANPAPPCYFTIDDGSGLMDQFGNPGIGVYCGNIMPPPMGPNPVSVTGLSSMSFGQPVILVRDAADIN